MTRFFTKCLGLFCLAVLCCFSLQNVAAQCGAGETEVTLEIFTGTSFPEEIAWELLDGSDVTVDEVSCDTYGSSETDTNNYCLNDGETYTFNMYDSFGDSWGSSATATLTLTDSGCAIASFTDPGASSTENSNVSGNPLVTGCSSQSAAPDLEVTFSFDPGEDIGGCMDPAADNYNACATVDDGSCFFNDVCIDAESIECGDVLSGTTTGASFDDVGFCGTSNSAPGVWYHFIGTGADVTASLCNTATFDTKISVFEGSCDALVCVGGNDDGTGCSGFTSEFTFTSVKCTDYYILVHGFGVNTGDFEITLNCSEDIEVIAEGCTDPTAHNYEAAACEDDSSCETCTDGILNGDELDVDCGGDLCDPCPCGIQVEVEVAVYESGCEAGPANRVVTVTFTDGIPPVSYDTEASGSSFISQVSPGVFQVVGYGPWSIEASDPSDCVQVGDSDDLVYVSDTDARKETGANQNDGSAMVEVTGGTPPYSVVWSNGADGVIEASGGTHENVNLASGYYEAIVTDDDGGTAKACVYVGRQTTRGGRSRGRKTADVNELHTLIAQPNPLSNATMIRFNVPESTQATVSVFSLNGKEVATIFDGEAEKGQVYNVELDASKMASGVYILRLTTESGMISHERIVVTK